MGITLGTLQLWRGRPVSVEDVENLSEGEARAIYQSRYFTQPHLDKIHDPKVQALAFDSAINHGPQRVVRWIQKIVGVVDDGIFGPATEIAVNTCDSDRLFKRLLARRIVFYGEILKRDRSQAVFALGWLRRAASFLEEE